MDDEPIDAPTAYPDADADGVGTDSGAVEGQCTAPEGFVTQAGDCSPDDPAVYPGAAEVCWDGRDNDCDPETHGACGLTGVVSTEQAQTRMTGVWRSCRSATVAGAPSLVCGGNTLSLYQGPFASLTTPRPVVLSRAGARDNSSFALADVVGDAEVDLVAVSGEVFEGPLGPDSTAAPLLELDPAVSIDQGDFDGDGATDVVFQFEDSLMVAAGPLHAGPLSDHTRMLVDAQSSYKAWVGDVVGDAADDLAVNSLPIASRLVDGRTTGTVMLADLPAWGTNGPADVLPTAPWLGSDTLLDRSWTLWESPLGDSPETSTPRATIETVNGRQRELAAVGDLDNDGLPDLVYRDNDWIYVVPLPSSGQTSNADAFLSIQMGSDIDIFGFNHAFVDDFDGDGLNDLVIYGTVGGSETSPLAGALFFFGSGQ